MTMRVTEVAKREQVMGNIQRNSAKLQELQTQMASGQRINRPLDDPMGAVKMQDIVTKLSTNEQLRGNLAENVSFSLENRKFHFSKKSLYFLIRSAETSLFLKSCSVVDSLGTQTNLLSANDPKKLRD